MKLCKLCPETYYESMLLKMRSVLLLTATTKTLQICVWLYIFPFATLVQDYVAFVWRLKLYRNNNLQLEIVIKLVNLLKLKKNYILYSKHSVEHMYFDSAFQSFWSINKIVYIVHKYIYNIYTYIILFTVYYTNNNAYR